YGFFLEQPVKKERKTYYYLKYYTYFKKSSKPDKYFYTTPELDARLRELEKKNEIKEGKIGKIWLMIVPNLQTVSLYKYFPFSTKKLSEGVAKKLRGFAGSDFFLKTILKDLAKDQSLNGYAFCFSINLSRDFVIYLANRGIDPSRKYSFSGLLALFEAHSRRYLKQRASPK
ncbi:MAG: hypothetical protein ABIF92_02215, partial [archaeon]